MKLRYITHVDVCPACHLRTAHPLADGVHINVPSYIPWSRVCISGLAALEVADAVEDGIRTYTSKLTITLEDRIAMARGPVAFRLTAADGTQFVMGLAERPHPVLTVSDSHPAKASSVSACTLSAEWRSPFSPLIIVPYL